MSNEIRIPDLIEQTWATIGSEGVCTDDQAHAIASTVIWSLYRQGRFNSSVLWSGSVLKEAFNAYRHAHQQLGRAFSKMLKEEEEGEVVMTPEYRKAQDELVACERDILRAIEEVEKQHGGR